MSEQVWITEGRKFLGIEENKDETILKGWVTDLKQNWFTKIFNKTVPWCGVYVAHCLQVANLPIPATYMRAKDWLNYGVAIQTPVPGCIVVFTRQGGGHVGFVVGVTPDGLLLVLGGNQNDRVTIARFKKDNVSGYVWVPGIPLPTEKLPVLSLETAICTKMV